MEVTTGRKYTVRKKLTPRTFTLISRARPRAIPACRGTTKTANRMVLRRDLKNTGSWNSRLKLSIPTNEAGCGETSFALVKANAKVSAIGMSTNVTIRMTAGATSQAAARPWVRPDRRCRWLNAVSGTGGSSVAVCVMRTLLVGPGTVRGANAPRPARPADGVTTAAGSSCWTAGWRRYRRPPDRAPPAGRRR